MVVPVTDVAGAVNRGGSGDSYRTDAGVGFGEVQLQGTAEVAESKRVGVALGIHGKLLHGTRDIGLCGGQGDVHAIGSQRGRIVSAAGSRDAVTAHAGECRCGGGCLRGGRVNAVAASAVDGNLVAGDPVEVGAIEDGFALNVGTGLHGGGELAVTGFLLIAGGEY